MDLSGIIFVALAVAWAGYLIPKALKHHDEVARTRSVDRFSTAMRVLATREPVSRRDARLVVTGARSVAHPAAGSPDTGEPAEPRPVMSPRARRAAARAAARRRRRILSFLLLADLVVAGLAVPGVVPVWAPVVPVVLTLLYLVLCRTQVRGQQHAEWDQELQSIAEAQVAHGFEEVDPDEDTVALPVDVLEAIAVPTVDGDSLWDPLPMTLPTYVGKPKAKRTVRTIDLGDPGTWTSGRTEEDARLVAETEAAQAAEAKEAEASGSARAVGS